jgi:hypothetical protein
LYDLQVISALVVILCAMGAFLLRNRPDILVLSYAALWIILPPVYVDTAHIAFRIHPAIFLILFGFGTTAIMSSSVIRTAWKDSVEAAWGIYGVLLAFLALAALSQVFSANVFGGLTILLGQILAPLAAFGMVRCSVYAGQRIRHLSLSLILGMAAAESILALVQSADHEWWPLAALYQGVNWHERYGGTLNHPLVLGLFLSVAVWCLWYVPKLSVRLGLAALFLAGINVTGARTALIIGIAGLVVTLALAPLPASNDDRSASQVAFLRRLVSIAAVAIGALLTWDALVGSNVVHRFISTDDESARLRRVAYGVFFEHVHGFLIYGGGTASNFDYAREHGSPLSFENPIMQYTVDFGLLAALLFFGVQAVIAVRAFRHQKGPDGSIFLAMTAVAAIVVTQGGSSLATNDASAMLLWLVLALASAPSARDPWPARESLLPSSNLRVPPS